MFQYRMTTTTIFMVCICVLLLAFPLQWYPRTLRLLLAEVVGATNYQPVPPSKISTSKNLKELDIEQACPDDITGARAKQEITGVVISASKKLYGNVIASVFILFSKKR